MSADDPAPLYDVALNLRGDAMDRCVNGMDDGDEAGWSRGRRQLVDEHGVRARLPSIVLKCRTLDDVRDWVDAAVEYESGDYMEKRKAFIRQQFDPLLDHLEGLDTAPMDALVSTAVDRINVAHARKEWSKAMERRASDPPAAITSARTLLESVCKVILDDHGEQYAPGEELPKLYKAVQKVLKLAPDDRNDADVTMTLRSVVGVVQGIGEIRNRGGDAHGKGRKGYSVNARHASLTVSIAGALSVFLIETHELHRPWAGLEIASTVSAPDGFFAVWQPKPEASGMVAQFFGVVSLAIYAKKVGGSGPHPKDGRAYFLIPMQMRHSFPPGMPQLSR